MDRAEILGRAVYAHGDTSWCMWGGASDYQRSVATRQAIAAVRAAYEIDGVRDLVEAALSAAASLDAEIGSRYKFADGHVHPAQQRAYERDIEEVNELRAAAARVREAMGNTKETP